MRAPAASCRAEDCTTPHPPRLPLRAGRRFIVFFQDTNALCFTVSIAAIGVSEQRGYDMNSVCVPRKAKDAVGAITRLVRTDGSSLTVNVEYNQLEPCVGGWGGEGEEGPPSAPSTRVSAPRAQPLQGIGLPRRRHEQPRDGLLALPR